MKITLDQPLCIYEIGRRPMQQDHVIPAFGEARCSDCHFMVAEGPSSEAYHHKASLDLVHDGISLNIKGECRAFQIRPGFDEPLFCSSKDVDCVIDDIQTGDWLLIMTDGMCEFMTVEDLVAIVNRPDWTAEHKRDALLDYTSENEDNHSAYLLHIRSVDDDDFEDVFAVSAPEPIEQVKNSAEPVKKAAKASALDISTKSLLVFIASAYIIAGIAGFFIGMFS